MAKFCIQLFVLFAPDDLNEIEGKAAVDRIACRMRMTSCVHVIETKIKVDRVFWDQVFPIYLPIYCTYR